MTSAFQHPEVIDESLHKERIENCIAGPYTQPPFPNLICSGLGTVPKSNGSWRLIYHLSAPPGTSINEFIDPTEYSLQYHTIDDAINICCHLGRNALLAKVDLKNAFRLCPVHPEDLHLLGIRWRGHYFVDKCLPFGLHSAPFLFNMVADAIQWILENHCHVQHSFHYLDNYFFAGPSDSQACGKSLSSMLSLCDTLNIPLKPEKMVGPTTSLTFLGVELDTTSMTARLPQDKLTALLSELHHFAAIYQSNQSCSKRDLLSLIGKLAFACKVIPIPGVQNCIADSLSRFQMDRFRSLAPDALPLPVTTPAIPTFTSELDRGNFSRQELHPPRGGHMQLGFKNIKDSAPPIIFHLCRHQPPHSNFSVLI